MYCLSTLLLDGVVGARATQDGAEEDDPLQELWSLVAKEIDTDAVKWWCVRACVYVIL